MAKRTKSDAEVAAAPAQDAKKQKKEKTKQKEGKSAGDAKPAAPGTFSLFGGQSNSELDDVFSKGAAFAVVQPAQAVASSSRIVAEPPQAASEPVASSSKPAKKARRDSATEVASEKRLPIPVTKDDEDESEDEDDDEEDVELVHEAEASKSKSKKTKTKTKPVKYVPENESKEDRDRRTIFVGNLSLEVAKSKSGLAQLRAHIATFVPSAKIESARLRSVPFATPTAASADTEEEGQRRAKREKERARAWKDQQELLKSGGKKEKEELDLAKTFIDAKGKRKVAFIKKEFHAEADSCNAYVVFAYPPPDRPSNLPPILDPFEAATLALKADGSTFLNRKIRVDTARLPSSEALQGATTALKKRDAWTAGSDPKRTAFVGGLDYAAKEEDLRVFFEELIKAERGAREDGSTYVTSVRVVRDKETQMGKGFAYVHFVDTDSVDEVLGIDQAKLRFAKKPLRIQRAKTLPSAPTAKPAVKPTPNSSATGTKHDAKAKTSKPAPKPLQSGPVPKGNPLLGEKIRSLSKEDRKVAKSADEERQARRMAKKKLRGKMGSEAEKGAVKLHATKGEKARSKKVVAKKGRVRSSNALAKMKGSRS